MIHMNRVVALLSYFQINLDRIIIGVWKGNVTLIFRAAISIPIILIYLKTNVALGQLLQSDYAPNTYQLSIRLSKKVLGMLPIVAFFAIELLGCVYALPILVSEWKNDL